jgi:hypothetical protein
MPTTETPPLLFLDVDGPLIPFGGSQPYPAYGDVDDSHPLLVRINPALGNRLRALPCELVWATTWMADANASVAPRLGLPDLPLVDWPDDEEYDVPRLHWKTRALVAWAAGRAFVWLDDELTTADETWVKANHPGPALLHRVDAACGLTDADFAVVERWLGFRG